MESMRSSSRAFAAETAAAFDPIRLAVGQEDIVGIRGADEHRDLLRHHGRIAAGDGEHAELLGSDRLAYWELNHPGDESALEKLGLTPRPPRTP